MNDEKLEQCKSKDCYNPVLDGKYCEYCKQIKKEKRGLYLKATFGAVVGISSYAYKYLINKPPKTRDK